MYSSSYECITGKRNQSHFIFKHGHRWTCLADRNYRRVLKNNGIVLFLGSKLKFIIGSGVKVKELAKVECLRFLLSRNGKESEAEVAA